MPIVNFTARWVKSVKSPPSGQLDYWDKKLRRFSLRVTSGGRKTWTIYYRFHGRKRRMSIGTLPPVVLANARRRANSLLNQVDEGKDPQPRSSKFYALRRSESLLANILKNTPSQGRKAGAMTNGC